MAEKPQNAGQQAQHAQAKPRGLFPKIAWVQAQVGHVEKTGEVRFGSTKFKHMQEHGLLAVLKPLLSEVGLVVFPSITTTTRDGNHTFVAGELHVIDAETGQGITASFANEGVDNQDKATNKAMTGFMKYALQKFFLVPTEDIDDNETVDTDSTAGTRSRGTDAEDVAFRNTVNGLIEEKNVEPNTFKAFLQGELGVGRLEELDKPGRKKALDWLTAQ